MRYHLAVCGCVKSFYFAALDLQANFFGFVLGLAKKANYGAV
jgi:hypothetical protein